MKRKGFKLSVDKTGKDQGKPLQIISQPQITQTA
jgi:hypothetical protein